MENSLDNLLYLVIYVNIFFSLPCNFTSHEKVERILRETEDIVLYFTRLSSQNCERLRKMGHTISGYKLRFFVSQLSCYAGIFRDAAETNGPGTEVQVKIYIAVM